MRPVAPKILYLGAGLQPRSYGLVTIHRCQHRYPRTLRDRGSLELPVEKIVFRPTGTRRFDRLSCRSRITCASYNQRYFDMLVLKRTLYDRHRSGRRAADGILPRRPCLNLG
jgi:hypothetical protein